MSWENDSEFQDPNTRHIEQDELHNTNTRHPRRQEDDHYRDFDSHASYGEEDEDRR